MAGVPGPVRRRLDEDAFCPENGTDEPAYDRQLCARNGHRLEFRAERQFDRKPESQHLITGLYVTEDGTIQEARKLREKLKNLPNEVLMGQRIREIDEAISIHQVFLGTIHWELRNGDGKDSQLDLFKNCNL